MQPIVTIDAVVWSVCLCRSVGRSQSSALLKTAELIKMLFGLWILVGPRNHVLDGGPDPLCRGTILRGIQCLHGKWLAERTRLTILLNESELWRNAGPSEFQLQETVLKNDKNKI